jgi:hypothetical protein
MAGERQGGRFDGRHQVAQSQTTPTYLLRIPPELKVYAS